MIERFFPGNRPESPHVVCDVNLLPRGGSHLGFPGSDDELIRVALRAKNRAQLQRLLDGDASGYGGNLSRMDQALANILAFWAGPDEDRLVRLMLRYGPVRDKWTGRLSSRSDYLRHTVRTAIRDCDRYYGSQDAAVPGEPQADDGKPAKPRFQFLRADEFFATRFDQEFLVDGVLVRNQPGVIAGPSKGMKTSLMLDMSVSLATGTPFLGEFNVRNRVRVAVVSGESGGKTVQETAGRVCSAKGISTGDLADWWSPCFDLPRFTDPATMREFAGELVKLRADVVFIDPVYLCVGGQVDHANLFQMGDAFRAVAEELLAVGCTPMLLHHANRGLQLGSHMELRDLSYAGLEQFARQWVLVNRQRAYQGDGIHELLVAVGGSAGHGARLAVRVDEGKLDDDFNGRTWHVTLQSAEEAAAGRSAARQDAASKRVADEEEAVLGAIDAEVASGLPGATRTSIKERLSMSGSKLGPILDRLTADERIVSVEFKKPGGNRAVQTVQGFRRAPDEDGRIGGQSARSVRPMA